MVLSVAAPLFALGVVSHGLTGHGRPRTACRGGGRNADRKVVAWATNLAKSMQPGHGCSDSGLFKDKESQSGE